MAEEIKSINERMAAQKALIAATRRAGDSLSPFSTWLLAGFGGAFSLVLANIETVSNFVAINNIRFGLLLFLISLSIAVLATYLSTIVKAALGAHEDGDAIGKGIRGEFDLEVFMSEYERGLLPPIRWIARFQMKKAMSGDIVASARMIAKLAQFQAILVVCQSILALVAVGAMACGLK